MGGDGVKPVTRLTHTHTHIMLAVWRALALDYIRELRHHKHSNSARTHTFIYMMAKKKKTKDQP